MQNFASLNFSISRISRMLPSPRIPPPMPTDHDNPVIEMLVLQPTPFCNIDCAYCYLPDRSSRQRMSEATLARAFERVFSSPFLSDSLTVLWHAGEPLVPGIAYYERAFAILMQYKPKQVHITHNFQ